MTTLSPQAVAILAKQQADYDKAALNSTRGQSALALAEMALEHGSGSAKAAAELLLSMEFESSFNFMELLTFDSTNRAHADVVMKGYRPCELWPSKWMDEEGQDGQAIINKLAAKWNRD